MQPVFTLLLYGFVFTKILKVKTGTLPYLTMAWTGLICYQYFAQATQAGANAFILEARSLTKLWYPRLAVPLAFPTAALFDLAIGLVLLVIVAAAQGIKATPHLVAVPAGLIVIVIWGYACALLLAPLCVFVRDLLVGVPLILRVAFFATPVMYSAATIPHQYQWLIHINPLAVGILAVRDAALAGTWPDWGVLAIHLAAGLLLLGLGVVYLRKVENRMVDLL